MAITGYRKNLVDWNETGNNSKLKISQANIKKENDLKEECKACYIDSGVPLPKDIVKSMIVTLHDIRNSSSPREKEKRKAKNADASAAVSALRKKRKDPNQYLDEAKQVASKGIDASVKRKSAKETALRKRGAVSDPTNPLTKTDQVTFKKLKGREENVLLMYLLCVRRRMTQTRNWTNPSKPGLTLF
jgi:hypothetical protein